MVRVPFCVLLCLSTCCHYGCSAMPLLGAFNLRSPTQPVNIFLVDLIKLQHLVDATVAMEVYLQGALQRPRGELFPLI